VFTISPKDLVFDDDPASRRHPKWLVFPTGSPAPVLLQRKTWVKKVRTDYTMLNGTAVPVPKYQEKISDSLARGSAEQCSLSVGRLLPVNADTPTTLHKRLGLLPMDRGHARNRKDKGFRTFFSRFTQDVSPGMTAWPPMFDVLGNHLATQLVACLVP
jgi:hypothetical protein